MSTPAPYMIVNGKKITMAKPKIKLWRHLVQFNAEQQAGDGGEEAALDSMIDIIIVAFNSPEITKEIVEENMDFEEVITIFNYISQNINSFAAMKTAQFPNAKTPTGKR